MEDEQAAQNQGNIMGRSDYYNVRSGAVLNTILSFHQPLINQCSL
ncbi:hypothetical protein XENTR_v10002746 [Xenopus tropicalis]|nr:hypothetical protein XENTR_v10002746 [Xenopus tropicalis]